MASFRPCHRVMETGVYHPRNPKNTSLYQLIEDYFDDFRTHYEHRYEAKHGPLRPIVSETVNHYLDCGILENGFCRVYCDTCKKDFLLAFSCKETYFCPSCHQMRMLQWTDWVTSELLADVFHTHLVFTIPRALRSAFQRDRKLLGKLSVCAADTIKEIITTAFPETPVQPGIICCIQTSGKDLQWHPHLHILTTRGGFDGDDAFHNLPYFPEKEMALLFREKVFQMMIKAHRLSEAFAAGMRTWTWPGFSVHQSGPVQVNDDPGKERLTQYLIKAPFALTRIEYDPAQGVVIYHSPQKSERFDPLDFIFLLQKHIPNKGEVMVRYYGYYANAARGKRKRTADGEPDPVVIRDDSPEKRALRQRWAAMIKKMYAVDPLICSNCGSAMRIIAFIDQRETILRILKHLKLWPPQARDPPLKKSSVTTTLGQTNA